MTAHHLVLPATVRLRRSEPTDEDVESAFKRWYAVYPRKVDPRRALSAYRAALKRGATIFELATGVRRYAAETAGYPKQYIKHPSTWLNGDGYLSEPEPAANSLSAAAGSGTQSARYALERTIFPGRAVDFSRHFLRYVVDPAERLRLAGAPDRTALATHLGYLYLRIEQQRRTAKFESGDYEALMGDSALLRAYVDWLSEQGWHTATVAVLQFDSAAFSQFRRETALADQFGRDPVTKRSRYS